MVVYIGGYLKINHFNKLFVSKGEEGSFLEILYLPFILFHAFHQR